MRKFLTALSVLEGEQDRIANIFAENREAGISAYREMLEEVETQQARSTLANAKNYWLINELFLSPEVNAKVEEIVTALANAYASAATKRNRSVRGGTTFLRSHEQAMEKANASIRSLKEVLTKELKPDSISFH